MAVDLSKLNEPQREAVEYIDGPSLVIAGAGSGKTRVLTYKIAYLISQGLKPHQILALTFTKKAASEMKERIAALLGADAVKGLWMGTFHSQFAKILRMEADKIGLKSDFTIYDTSDSQNLIKSIVKEKGLDIATYKPKKLQARISSLKNDLITPKAYKEIEEFHHYDQMHHMLLFGDIYAAYQNRMVRAGAVDFDDILVYMNILLRDEPQVAFKYQNKFRFVLVDEYQDTNAAQARIVRRLCGGHKKLCVVGDDAQSIYSFRGADIENILQFQRDYEGAKVFKLEQNYRSTQSIVAAASSLISKNKNQLKKEVFSANEKGEPVTVISHFSDHEEAKKMALTIANAVKKGGQKYSDFALLYRTNAQSRLLEMALRNEGVPAKVVGGKTFFECKEVKDVVAYLRLTANHTDEEAFKRIVNYPLRGIGDTTVEKITTAAANNGVSVWDVICNPMSYIPQMQQATANKVMGFQQLIQSFEEKASTTEAYALVEHIMHKSGVWTDIYSNSEPGAETRQQNLNEILKSVHEYCQKEREENGTENPTLSGYLEDIALLSSVDASSEDENNKVTLMTVHASKGLEFPVVAICGMEEEIFPSSMSTADDSGIEEERRLFYVAITRAEKVCIISYCKSRFDRNATKQMMPSRFIKDIDPSLLKLPKDLYETSGAAAMASRGEARWANSNFKLGGGKEPEPQRRLTSIRGNLRPMSEATKRVTPNVDLSRYKVGTFVRHNVYGNGQIIALEGNGIDVKAIIKFRTMGEKRILLKYATTNLSVIE